MKAQLYSVGALAALVVSFFSASAAFSAEQDLAKLFGAPPQFADASLSPNGKTVALIAAIDGVDNILTLPLDSSGKPSRFAISDSRPVQILWHDDAHLIARLRFSLKPRATISTLPNPSGAYYLNAYRYFVLSPDGQKPAIELKTELPDTYGPVSAIVDLNPSDPNNIFVSTLTAQPGLMAGPNRPSYSFYRNSLLRVSLLSGGGALVQEGEPTTAKWIMDGDGNIAARIDVAATHQDDVYVPSASGFRKIATISDVEGHIMGLTEDGKSLAIAARRENNRLGLYRLNLSDGKFGDLLFTNPGSDIRGVLTDRSFRVIGVTYDDGALRFFYFSPERQNLQKQIEGVLPGRGASIISTSTDRSKVLVVTSGPQNAPLLQLVNVQAGQINTIAEAYPQLRGLRLGVASRYGYKTKGGISLAGVLTLPPQGDPKKLPLLVLPAGGFGDGRFDWFAQYISQRGYAVLQAGARDAKELGDAANMDELGAWMNAIQEDIGSGIDDLVANGTVDPKRVCIAGKYDGGYVALAAPVFLPDHYACSISFQGFSDIKVLIRGAPGAARWASNTFNSSLIRNNKEYSDEDLERFSPALRVNQIKAPILLVAGERNEAIVQSEIMKNALTAAKKPVEMVTLKSEDGSLATAESRSALLNAVDNFLANHIGR